MADLQCFLINCHLHSFLSACLVSSNVLNFSFCSRVYLIPGFKRIVVNMNSTSSQRGYPAKRWCAANMSSTSMRHSSEPWTHLTHKQRRPQWAYNPRTMRPPPLSTDTNSMKILSWNVNGLQAIVQSGFSADELVAREDFDVLCLQETHLEASCFGVSIAAPSYTASSWAVGCFDVYMGFLNNPIYHDMVIFLYDAHIPMP
jgi:hypothetical protein